tara:strand:- start:169 stop:657 length:489 start_codon:yes stop_codon:yes gene_type:complete
MSKEVERQFRLGKTSSAKKQRERDLARLKTLSKAPKDPDYRSGFTKSGEETRQLGRPPKPKPPKPPRGSGKYMTQFEKDMNKAKKEGNVKEQKRLERVKKSIEANIKKFGDQSKNVKKPGPKGPRMGVATGRRAKNVPTSILKRMNMGGVMKGRGGTFKGVY